MVLLFILHKIVTTEYTWQPIQPIAGVSLSIVHTKQKRKRRSAAIEYCTKGNTFNFSSIFFFISYFRHFKSYTRENLSVIDLFAKRKFIDKNRTKHSPRSFKEFSCIFIDRAM